MTAHHPARRVLALASLLCVAACGGDAERAASTRTPDTQVAEAFEPPPPPRLTPRDLPTDRPRREAEREAAREAAARAAIVEQVDELLAARACDVADGLMGRDGRVWLDALGDRARLARYPALGARVTGRGIAAACLLAAIDSGHVRAHRRDEAWRTLDRVVGASDWPEPRTVYASSRPAAGPTGRVRLDVPIRLDDGLRLVRIPDRDATSSAAQPQPGVDALLRVVDRLEADVGAVTIPREPPEGWNPAAGRVFDEMPAVLRSIVDTDDLHARVSSHAGMRGW